MQSGRPLRHASRCSTSSASRCGGATERRNHGSAKSRGLRHQARTPAAELLLENAVLLDELVDRLGLLAVDPAGEGGEEKLEL